MTRLCLFVLAVVIAVPPAAFAGLVDAASGPAARAKDATPSNDLRGAAMAANVAAPANRFLVVPGRSMGPVAIGMRLDAVESVFGHPSKVDPNGRTHWYEWKSPDNHLRSIAVETLQNTVVLISLAHDPRYRTREGLGDGTTLAEVQRVLGRPSSVIRLGGFSIVQYRRQGIGFVTDGTDHVTGIVIAPGV